jgi:gluconate 2-dehydrogenase
VVLTLTTETHHIISEKQLNIMKNSAILVNIGRGSVIDEKSLIKALQNNTSHAARLDIFEKEPLYDSPLFSLPNVIALPHVGSATYETRYNMAKSAVENLVTALSRKIELC